MWSEARAARVALPRVAAAALFITAACTLSGCGLRGHGQPSVIRFIEHDPQEFVDRSSFVADSTTLEWDPTAWRSESGIDRLVPHQGRLLVYFRDQEAVLVQDVELQAADLRVLELTMSGVKRLSLQWATRDLDYSDDRKVVIRPTVHEPRPLAPHRIVTTELPGWDGTIRQLRLTVERRRRATTAELHGVRGVAERLRADRVPELVARPWKVDLDGDVRNALLAMQSSAITHELDLPRDSRLQFGYGVQPLAKLKVVFKVSIEVDGGPGELLFRGAAKGGANSRWTDATVDLAAFGGKSARLIFEVIAGSSIDPRNGFPVWSNPEVVRPAVPRPPNLVLISIDTLRADRLSMYGHALQTSPNLDAWAHDSAVVFATAVAQAPWTLPSHVSLFTGEETFHHGTNHRREAPSTLVTMAEYLREAGYATVAFTGGGFVHPRFGFSQGFDSYRYWSDRHWSEEELEAGLQQALDWLDSNGDRPFFLFFHSFEVHSPYRARQPFYDQLSGPDIEEPDGEVWVREDPPVAETGFRRTGGSFVLINREGGRQERELGEADLPMVKAAYDSGIAYMDHHLIRLIDRVREIGDATVVFTSDHGETLGERGDAGHGSLDEANVLVPLIVAFADGRGAGTVVPTQVRSIDVLPTVLDQLGIEPTTAMDGVSLLPLVGGRADESHRPAWTYVPAKNLGLSLRLDDRFKYVFNDTAWAGTHGREELYDLAADPAEEQNLAAGASDIGDFRREVSAALEGSACLRLRIDNRTDSVFAGRIRSRAIQPARVKRPPLESGAVRWREPGLAELVVDPLRRLSLSLLNPTAETIVIEGAFGGDGPTRLELEVPDRGSVTGARLTSEGWGRQVSDEALVRMAVEMWWIGEHEAAGHEPAEADPELRERLKALGYLQ